VIVRAERGRLRLTLQTDHAMLAGEFAGAWGGESFAQPVPLAAVRIAAEMHDDGWEEWEREPLVMPDSGRPYDFMSLPPDQHVPIYERGIRLALDRHPYAGLLASLHGTGLYKRRYGYMPDMNFRDHAPEYQPLIDRYLSEQKALQDQLVAELGADEEALWTHYRWLQAWDLLSLFLSQGDPAERKSRSLGSLPRSPGGAEERLVVQGAGPGLCTVAPWPFAAPQLDLVLPVRYLPDQHFESDKAFQEAFAAAPTEALAVSLVPGSDAPDTTEA
jgi:hypothetical protein